jgi:hypothetical protein
VDVRYDGDLTAPVHATVTAGDSRADLCTSLGSCAHAFTLAPPHALLDGKPHTARAYATDTGTGLKVLLPGSPKTFTCAPPTDAAAPPASADGGAADAATSEPSAPGPNDSPATEPPGADGGAQSAEAPQPGGCSAAPGSPSSLPWSSLALLALALYARRRAAAPARR